MWSYSVNLECAVEMTRQSVHSDLKRRPTALLCGALHCGASRDGSLLCGKKTTETTFPDFQQTFLKFVNEDAIINRIHFVF